MMVYVRLARKGTTLERRANLTEEKVTTLRGSNGSVAEPVVNLFTVRSGGRADGSEEGTFHTMEQLQTLRDQKGSPFAHEGEDVTDFKEGECFKYINQRGESNAKLKK